MGSITSENENQIAGQRVDFIVGVDFDDEAQGSVEAVAMPLEGADAGEGSMAESMCDTNLEHEEGEISDDNEQDLEDHERAEKSGFPVDLSEKDGSGVPNTPSVLDNAPVYLNPVLTSYPRWSGRFGTDKRGWGWRTDASSFSPQPDQFYQIAWQKGVQGSPKDFGGESPQEDAGNTTGDSFSRDFRGHEAPMKRYHILRDGLLWANNTGDTEAGSGVALHRSASWSGNRDVERLTSKKAGWLVGDRGIEYASFLRSDDGYLLWDETGERFEQGKCLAEDSLKARDDACILNKGMPERPITIKSTVEQVGREVLESEEKVEILGEERNVSSIETLPILQEAQIKRIDATVAYKDDGQKDELEELEEGEIEGGLSEQNAPIDKMVVDKPVELVVEKQLRRSKSREKQVGKLSERPYSLSRHYDRESHRHTAADYDKERLLAECVELVRNVAVKDAQKSFIGVCRRLRKALKLLRDLNKRSGTQDKLSEGFHRRVSDLSRQAFSGIRAAYAVRNTAIGKEQEQDTDFFPRLLELANSSCQKLFSSKQIRELNAMMQTIGRQSKGENSQKAHNRSLLQLGTERIDEKDLKVGESSGNTSATTQLESESTTDTSANGRTLDIGDEAEQFTDPSGVLPHGVSALVDGGGMSAEEIPAASIGYGGWFPVNPEQGQVQAYANSIGIGLSVPSMLDSNLEFGSENNRSYQIYGSGFDMDCTGGLIMTSSGTDTQEASSQSRARLSSLDPVSAVTSYREKFAGKSRMQYTRLPSPTPSDEDEEARSNNRLESSRVSVNVDLTDVQLKGRDTQVVGTSAELQPTSSTSSSSYCSASGNAQHEASLTSGGNYLRSVPPELRLFPSSELLVVENRDVEIPKVKPVPMLVRGPKKSRDPRRRLVNGLFDSEHPQKDVNGTQGATEEMRSKQHLQVLSLENPILTLATGGWLPEHSVDPNVLEEPIEMDLGNEKSHMISDSTDTVLVNLPKRDRQVDCLNKEISSKRQKLGGVRKETDDKSSAEGLSDLGADVATVPVVDSNNAIVVEKMAEQTTIRSVNALESMAGDSLKPRMKPRDPRRALLGSTLERKEISVLEAGKVDGPAASMNRAVSNSCPHVAQKDIEPGVLAKDAVAIPQETPSSSFGHNFMEKFGSQSSFSAGDVSFSDGNVSSGASESSSLPARNMESSDSNGNRSSSDNSLRAGKVSASEISKPVVARPSSKPDSHFTGGAAPKQRESITHWDNLEHLLEGLDEKQRQSVRQERARRIEEQSRMFNAKKLCLVLDLDHTLLNSAKFTEVEEEWEVRLRANEGAERNKLSKEGLLKRELYRFPHMGMWTKLRPGIWNFLARASQLYELHVYTMGNKSYATEMARLLDPTGTLFVGRVISKGDDGDGVDGDERPPKSKDLDGVLGMESAVVIIDDSARVWPHHRHNLIVVERYMYFPCSRKQFGLPGPSLLEVGHDERELDGMLASTLMVIEKIHFNFFSHPRLHEVDVRDILASEQRRVLCGCKIIFSRVFPQGESQPQLHPLWQTAEQFGAVCTIALDDEVTHVVALSLGTDKVNWASATGRFVVRPAWLEASAILYRRANEHDFPVSPYPYL